MYSLVPFYSLYTSHFDSENTTNVNDDIVHQLDLLYSHCFDNSTGLLHHGYDASKTAVWANPITGSSSIVWSRAMGWYFMSLIDFLSATPIPHHSTTFKQILHLFISLSQAIIAAVDEKTGCWWQVVNFPGRAGNYIESSGSAMFTYALYKGARLGFLNDSVVQVASRAYEYLVHEFVVREGNGTLSWNGTVAICSLNSTASYEVCGKTQKFLDFGV
jgi:rhamnogalacturonyl hydrolase YesR